MRNCRSGPHTGMKGMGAVSRNTTKEESMKKMILIGLVILSVLSVAAAAAAARTGKEIYEALCQACHATGVSGAPKFGDAKWLTLEKKEGVKELAKDAVKGKKAMPPKGGCTDCTEAEIRAAVQYMIDSAKKK
jgi:cytochrome c5